jgi:hypothetical protein
VGTGRHFDDREHRPKQQSNTVRGGASRRFESSALTQNFNKRQIMDKSPKLLAIAITAFLLSACGTMGSFKEFQSKGDTIYLKGSVASIQEAAVKALAEKRLTSPELRPIADGVEIYAEQNVVAGIIFNSYGGYGKVTIVSDTPLKPGLVAVSAITRSRAAHEPVGAQDALKGYNYNNPLVARQILEAIKTQVNAKATN